MSNLTSDLGTIFRWTRPTTYAPYRPAILNNVPRTSEVSLDMERGGWWVRDRVWTGILRRGWSTPWLLKPENSDGY